MAIYHLTVRTGTRAKGTKAARKADYIERQNQYERQPDRCLYRESGNMPEWVERNPREYWEAADEHERANGRLFIEVEVALPRELSSDDRIELAREFARELTRESNLPYTMAVHEGRGKDGWGDNPHAHVMVSERQNDGVERDREAWFRRFNRDEPERGGALKTREFHGSEHIRELRERWEREANRALEREHVHERVDHRSLKEQGLEREPTRHYGPGVQAEEDRAWQREHGRDQSPERPREWKFEREELQALAREAGRAREEYERAHREFHQERELDRSRDRGLGR